MEEESLIICDSDVLIEFLDRANVQVRNKLIGMGFQNLCLSAVSAGELLVGAKDKRHFQKIQSFISELILIPITQEVTTTYIQLLHNYSLSHGLKVQDALIASSALVFDYPLYTMNRRDFKFIKGLRLIS